MTLVAPHHGVYSDSPSDPSMVELTGAVLLG